MLEKWKTPPQKHSGRHKTVLGRLGDEKLCKRSQTLDQAENLVSSAVTKCQASLSGSISS
jgi:hypothetical protein